jgi:hypothetical protein
MLVWLAMTTGARRGELCDLRRDLLDLDKAVLSIRSSIAQDGAKTWEKDTKTHQQLRIALDAETVSLLRAYKQHCATQAADLSRKVDPQGRIFSPSIDHRTWLKPGTVSQRYQRMCEKLHWDMNIHELRHYSATELIAAGVDVRTVAGRLGHGGGGATTLRVYSAWVSEADQRAAGTMTGRMPAPPIAFDSAGAPVSTREPEADNPYQKIAADLRGAILCGALGIGASLPTIAVSIPAEYWFWHSFRDLACLGQSVSRTRLRSRSGLARPNIWRLSILKVTWNLVVGMIMSPSVLTTELRRWLERHGGADGEVAGVRATRASGRLVAGVDRSGACTADD